MKLSRPTKAQMQSIAQTPAGKMRLRKMQQNIQRERDEIDRRLSRHYGVPCPSDMAAERAQGIAECEALRDVCDGVLADCAEILGEVAL